MMVSLLLIEKYIMLCVCGYVFCEDVKKLNIVGDWWRLYFFREWCIIGEIDYLLVWLDIYFFFIVRSMVKG